MKNKKCLLCEKLIRKDRTYCYKHYQEYLAVKDQQMWSVEDEETPKKTL